MRLFAKFLGAFFAALCMTLAIAVIAPASPFHLPATECRPTAAQYSALKMEISYAAAATHLGCDGKLAKTEDLGLLQIKTYVWRGAGWPYDVIRLGFYNETLQKTERRTFTLTR